MRVTRLNLVLEFLIAFTFTLAHTFTLRSLSTTTHFKLENKTEFDVDLTNFIAKSLVSVKDLTLHIISQMKTTR